VTPWFRATVRWLRPDPPARGSTYSTPARFDLARDLWPQEDRSVLAEILSDPDPAGQAEGRVRLLFENAPSALLNPGVAFDFMEGERVAARVEVIRRD
jgi:hypothetical protein